MYFVQMCETFINFRLSLYGRHIFHMNLYIHIQAVCSCFITIHKTFFQPNDCNLFAEFHSCFNVITIIRNSWCLLNKIDCQLCYWITEIEFLSSSNILTLLWMLNFIFCNNLLDKVSYYQYNEVNWNRI